MARIINGLISGAVGPLIYYAVNGVQMVKQKAAKISRDIRKSLSAQLSHEHNSTLVNALNGAMFQSINHQWRERDTCLCNVTIDKDIIIANM